MKETTKKVFIMSIISTLLILAFGILIFIFPDTVIKTISIGMGILFLLFGVIPIFNYFKYRKKALSTTFGFMMGVFCIVAGLILIMNNGILDIIIPIIGGIWIIINSINRISVAMDLRDDKISSWFSIFAFAIISMIVGVLMILDPVNGGKLITINVGIIIIVYAVIDLVYLIAIKIKSKKEILKIDTDQEN